MLLTADDVVRRAHYRNAQRTLHRLLELGVVPVVNENDTVATDEIRFGDNDRLAALVAHLVHADALVLLSDVDGLYDGDPRTTRRHQTSPRCDEPPTSPGCGSAAPARSGLGTGGMATKVEAARIATGAGIAGRAGRGRRTPAPSLHGTSVGTCFRPRRGRPPTRLLWLAHATDAPRPAASGRRRGARGGRAAAVAAAGRGHRRSTATSRPATRSTCSTKRADRSPAAWSTMTRASCPALLGRSTRDLARELGPGYEREVVHRDDLVVLGRS